MHVNSNLKSIRNSCDILGNLFITSIENAVWWLRFSHRCQSNTMEASPLLDNVKWISNNFSALDPAKAINGIKITKDLVHSYVIDDIRL